MPTYRHAQPIALAFAPGATLPTTGYHASCPDAWLTLLERAWNERPARRTRKTNGPELLPTRSLTDLITLIDPAITAVHGNPRDPAWLRASAPVDPDLLLMALDAWAATNIAAPPPGTDWYTQLSEAAQLDWVPEDLDLADHALHPNGTARPAPEVFKLLPSLVAEHLTRSGLVLHGQPRTVLLGPTRSDGQRTIYLGVPEPLVDKRGAVGTSTESITFHLQTVPGKPGVHLHADLTMSRFASAPVSYVPRKGRGDTNATVLLMAADGFVHRRERPMLLHSALTIPRYGESGWAWAPGVAKILARLSRHPAPDLEQLRTDPASAAAQPFAAHLVHSTGMTYRSPQKPGDTTTASHDHPVGTGFQPRDHLEVLDQLGEQLAALGLEHLTPAPKAPTPVRARQRPQPPETPPAYTIDVWATSTRTWQAVQLAASGKLGLTPSTKTTDSNAVYRGPIELTLQRINPGDLTAGLPRPTTPDMDTAQRRTVYQQAETERATHIAESFPRSEEPRTCIVEMEGAAYFARLRQGDPKTLFKKTLPTVNRRVQCLRPIPDAPANPSEKALGRRLPGTDFTNGDIERTASALRDALRQAGHLPTLPKPRGIEDSDPFELLTIWLAPAGDRVVPILVRQSTDAAPTAQLMPSTKQRVEPLMPFVELPEALVAGRGRISVYQSRAALADFIHQALALDSHTHRLLLVRGARMRDDDIWPWLQDSHLTPDQMILPGVSLKNPDRPPTLHTPDDHKGLRIIRLREADDRRAVPRAFGVTWDEKGKPLHGRFSGLTQISERAYWGINPRSDQNQTPLGVSKFDPAQPLNRTWTCANPATLEIVPAFLQAGDDPADWAMYVHAQRRFSTHTDSPTTWPAIMHLAQLMEEYIV
jgi:hypothetical protein